MNAICWNWLEIIKASKELEQLCSLFLRPLAMRCLQGVRCTRRANGSKISKGTGDRTEENSREPTRKVMQPPLIHTRRSWLVRSAAWVIYGDIGWSRRGPDRDRSEGAAQWGAEARGREGAEGRLRMRAAQGREMRRCWGEHASVSPWGCDLRRGVYGRAFVGCLVGWATTSLFICCFLFFCFPFSFLLPGASFLFLRLVRCWLVLPYECCEGDRSPHLALLPQKPWLHNRIPVECEVNYQFVTCDYSYLSMGEFIKVHILYHAFCQNSNCNFPFVISLAPYLLKSLCFVPKYVFRNVWHPG